ncbi:response regulator transcription factor [Agaribacter marinus]|uniref:DNA-binding response regulator n=1 Tax=Agaribacter marinus TaxID=1431249 RepID=A0AA37SWP4_9ALTE|nr:response regulator transcription factor [Agaribacter marinus]GLR71136.1 DNA-binding response regulator [Agaribacter marinus]
MKTLLIEDEPTVADFIVKSIQKAGHACDHKSDGESGLHAALNGQYDVIILDRMLPKMEGIAVLDELKAHDLPTPVLFLSAKNTVEDRVTGLRAGADDYLTKPFAFEELLARIEILASRGPNETQTTTELVAGDLTLDLIERTAKRGNMKIDLQSKEFKLLEYLMLNEGKVITRAMLLEKVWEYNFDPQTNVIDVHISRLRNKIDKGFDQHMISTIRGAGYRFTVSDT